MKMTPSLGARIFVFVSSLTLLVSTVGYGWPSSPDETRWIGPSGFDYVGGTASNFPMVVAAGAGAPEIATMSEIGFSGDSVAVTGEGFSGAEFKVWSGDQTAALVDIDEKHVEVTPGADRAVLTLPSGLPKSTYFVWATKPDGSGGESKGAPIRVNAPAVTWTFPTSVQRIGSTSGSLLRLFGRNLSKPGIRRCSKSVISMPGSTRNLAVG